MIVEAQTLKEGNGKELRYLHDTVQQHLRALKTMEYEPSGQFITSILELKRDPNSMFEWQRYSQKHSDVPHYQELLEFLNLRAQASESSTSNQQRSRYMRNDQHSSRKGTFANKPVTSYAVSAIEQTSNSNCAICKGEKHPLYSCPKFRALCRLSTLKANHLCMNCLRPGHFAKDCRSVHRCKACQRPHHSMLHIEQTTPSISKFYSLSHSLRARKE